MPETSTDPEQQTAPSGSATSRTGDEDAGQPSAAETVTLYVVPDSEWADPQTQIGLSTASLYAPFAEVGDSVDIPVSVHSELVANFAESPVAQAPVVGWISGETDAGDLRTVQVELGRAYPAGIELTELPEASAYDFVNCNATIGPDGERDLLIPLTVRVTNDNDGFSQEIYAGYRMHDPSREDPLEPLALDPYGSCGRKPSGAYLMSDDFSWSDIAPGKAGRADRLVAINGYRSPKSPDGNPALLDGYVMYVGAQLRTIHAQELPPGWEVIQMPAESAIKLPLSNTLGP